MSEAVERASEEAWKKMRAAIEAVFQTIMPRVDEMLLAGLPSVRVVVWSKLVEEGDTAKVRVQGAAVAPGIEIPTDRGEIVFDRTVTSRPELLEHLRSRS